MQGGSAAPLRTSLRLLDLEAYSRRYEALKKRHAARLVKDWPESTDPAKFVFEDIATAAYLLVHFPSLIDEAKALIFADAMGNGTGLCRV